MKSGRYCSPAYNSITHNLALDKAIQILNFRKMNIPPRASFVLTNTIALIFLSLIPKLVSAQVTLIYPKTVRGIELSMTKVRDALNQNNYYLIENQRTSNDYVIKVVIGKDTNIKPEGYAIRKAGKQFTINAIDASGARYGALAFAEQISMKKDLNKIQAQVRESNLCCPHHKV